MYFPNSTEYLDSSPGLEPAPSTLVVNAHPCEDSYNAGLRDRVVVGLRASGTRVGVYRLGQGEIPPLARLAAANRLVVVYPTWGAGLPALLLNWLHQLMDQPSALAGITRLEAVTTHGSSRWLNWVQGPWGRRYLATTVLAQCDPRARFHWWPLYKVDRLGDAELKRHLMDTSEAFAAGC